MSNRHVDKRISMKDLPAEFFLPPPTNAGLWRETAALVLGCVGFIVTLAVVVALTHQIVIKI